MTAISLGRAGEELWRFSLAVYAAPGVAPHCLDLQDKCGADVNVVLALAWAGASGRGTVVTADLAALDREVAPLRRAVVEPLRAARRWLKSAAADDGDLDDLRTRIKAVELEAERTSPQCWARALSSILRKRGSPRPPPMSRLICGILARQVRPDH